MKTICYRLHDGEDLVQSINKLAADHNIDAGIILSAVGSLKVTNFRVPIIDGKIKMIKLTDVEINAVQGTVSKNGCHLHIAVSDLDGKAYGGHLKEGNIVRTTCELVIGLIDDVTFIRRLDATTGYNELFITKKPIKP